MKSLSIVIMAFNEEDNLPVQVARTIAFLEAHTEGWQLIIVDDGSSDCTGVIADRFAVERPDQITVIHHPTNQGMGMAIRHGYEAARCEWITQLPADCQVDPEVFLRFFPHTATSDIVLSTYRARDDGWHRTLLSRGFQATVRVLLGHRGDFTGTMLFRRSLLDAVGALYSESFFVNLEFPIKVLRLGSPHAVVEIEAQPRLHGQSKVANSRRVMRVLREIFAMRWRDLRGR